MKLVLLRMFPFKVMLTRELKMDKTTLQLELPTRLFFFLGTLLVLWFLFICS